MRCDTIILELVRLEKNLFRCRNLECKPFSSSMVKTDLIKKNTENQINSQWVNAYMLELLETERKTLTELCQMFVKQIEIMKEDTLPFQPTPLQKVW